MEENKKYKTASADDLFRIIDGLPASEKQGELDDFEREALEGLKMVKDRDRVQRIHRRIDEQLQEKKKNRGIVFWLSAAASLVLIIGLIYLIAPELSSKKEVSSAGTAAQDKEQNQPASNSDYKLAETRVEEVSVDSDTINFSAKDGNFAGGPNEKVEDEITDVRNKGTGYLNMTMDNENEVVAAKENNEVRQDVLLEDNSKMNPTVTTVTGTSTAADSISVAGNVATSNMVYTNATYNSPVAVQEKQNQEREKDKIKEQKLYQQQSYNNSGYNQSNTSSGEDLSVMQPSSDTSAGFYNGIAYENKKGKKRTQRKSKSMKSAAVQAESQYQSPGRKFDSADTVAYASGAKLREIVLTETLKKAESDDKANEYAFGATEDFNANATLTEFPGGFEAMQKFFRDNVKKPSAGFKGVVVASFTVNKDGTISNPRIISAIKDCDECSKEVLRVIRMMPKWKPATSSGKPISITYSLPVRF